MSWLIILPNRNTFCYTFSEALLSKRVRDRWTDTITMSLHRGAAGNNEIHQYFSYYKLTLWEALLTYFCFSSIKLIRFKYQTLAWSTIAKPCNNICFSSSSCFALFIYNDFNRVRVMVFNNTGIALGFANVALGRILTNFFSPWL